MRYLVDTNVISAARRGTVAATSWLRSVDPDDIYLSVVTLGEVMRGIVAKQTSDPATATHLLTWLNKIRRDHAARICRSQMKSSSRGAGWRPSDRAVTWMP